MGQLVPRLVAQNGDVVQDAVDLLEASLELRLHLVAVVIRQMKSLLVGSARCRA
jgi:hypothetical protein